MNPYQILGVSPDDSDETIKKAYRKAAKQCHPDTHPGDKHAEERFKEIGEAYRILSNKQKRKEYDAKAEQKEQEKTAGKKRSTAGSGTIYPGDIEKEFERFFSMGQQNGKKEKGTQQKGNPMDVTNLFERYMGLKR
ncbi:MAG: J domain-containing protein [Lachnospiraceae bacterium]|nr:J domain-containing protein [Lachnospiraceae bacterium]